LNGAKVLEAMCGSGQATRRLIESGAHVTGLDISDAQIESFRKRWPECDAVCASILDSGFEDCSFDAVVVIAGLHHITELCVQAVDEIHRILKPGGYFLFMEPHAGSLPDVIRQLWYSKDAMFGEGEKAIDLDSLKKSFSGEFGFELEKYIGNVAYMLILNSMVFRIPLWLKPLYSPLLMPIESLISIAQSKKLSCVSLSRWRKL
ncbi:MAG TPA: class I SAM-dependent methyltransferase, partial [bacterium]|nr:class I SAM-dependent methyltransferase [bacterium]